MELQHAFYYFKKLTLRTFILSCSLFSLMGSMKRSFGGDQEKQEAAYNSLNNFDNCGYHLFYQLLCKKHKKKQITVKGKG